ncbi:enoyl-CoA hydratase-related protein [Micromonospora sp. 4G57]|uniref:Enoyl-CoA hydratase-related protein n=1 Tax=Micromonospora sicca TaxID=2202420 RepID=A0ABU5JLI2_9ACTN|nr:MULTISPECIES: enoyl-CoA hydratase-related protein [unclassified Micromonospora]MDZ5446380.1 enoyl-CoA hydratase-related protein [Micromonospora sp. 4G57]MDZ5493431.1 enoyl-CoA hydratase-related protein [Micromonospora sp. 4G53]
MQELVVEDLGPAVLRAALKQQSRSPGSTLFIQVAGDAWDHRVTDADHSHPAVSKLHALVLAVHAAPGPVVVELQGAVSGLGLALALAADLRVAAPTATFSAGSPDGGALLLAGASRLLADAVGTGVLAQLAWTGAVLRAEEALARGLVGAVSADPEAARALAKQVAALAPSTASALARALRGRAHPDLRTAMEYEAWLAGV